MPKRSLATSVFDESIERFKTLYAAGHRVVVSFSGGKDSGVMVELAIIAARETGCLPVEVVMRDDEIMLPGTYEYAERVAARPEVRFDWMIAGQPGVNIFNRACPYFWVFDPLVPPDRWVRQPPDFAKRTPYQDITRLTSCEAYPPPPGKMLYVAVGLRTSESTHRLMAIHASKGYVTKPSKGMAYVRPIYDWSDGDVWRAISVNRWDYNHAYDVMFRLGRPARALRIASPTMSAAGVEELALAMKGWPVWFDKLCQRLPGVRSAAQFGRRVCQANRRLGETWEDCYKRECIADAPPWIAARAEDEMARVQKIHAAHSTAPLPQREHCSRCPKNGSWQSLAKVMYTGDPFGIKTYQPAVEPEFFRDGAGKWGGRATW